ncbi:hypothetical protein, partial [Bacteroides ovatus]|uniref:hypothetical protein n=1 Tax=Bacteroides ovatus TaxID=28116 RepID=UPI003DA63857
SLLETIFRELLEYVGFIYTKWEKINTDFLPFGSSIYGNICFDNVLLCLDFYITHIAFFFFCSSKIQNKKRKVNS